MLSSYLYIAHGPNSGLAELPRRIGLTKIEGVGGHAFSGPASMRQAQLFEESLSKPICFVETFRQGVRCRASDLQNFALKREFQRLTKECPAFAAEFAALGLRSFRMNWGPINRREAEIRPEGNVMVLQVQNFLGSEQVCSLLIWRRDKRQLIANSSFSGLEKARS